MQECYLPRCSCTCVALRYTYPPASASEGCMPLFAVAAVFWLTALLATPRRPLPHSPLDEVVYAQLRRHQQRIVTVAICVTMLVLLASVLVRPSGVVADAEAIRQERVAVEGCVT